MHATAEVNAKIAKMLAGESYGEVATDGAHNLGAFAPLHFDAPPSWLSTAIEQARDLGRAGNVNGARAVLAGALSSQEQRVQLGAYRDHVTWTERQNARRLTCLAWIWRTLYRSPDSVERDRALERVERFAHDHYQVTELVVLRGWAERYTRADYVLPTAWREA